MITWRNPAALGALVLVALPMAIHLLRQHRARRQPFPSLRFVVASMSAASRLRRLSDPWLLLLRTGIVVVAVGAAAEPLVLAPRRLEAWNARVARALVLDTSASIERNGAARARLDAAEAESRDAAAVARFDGPELRRGLSRAVAWLDQAPPARREIVVISDFHAGAVTADDVSRIPPSIGVRFVAVGQLPEERRYRGYRLAGDGSHDVTLTSGATAVTIAPGATPFDGLTLVGAPVDIAALDHLQRAIASAGTPAPTTAEPVVVVFAGGEAPGDAGPLRAWWMRSAVLRLSRDDDVRAATADADAAEGAGDRPPWVTVLQDRKARPIVRAASAGSSLVLRVDAPAASFVAAAVVQGALRARAPSGQFAEQEILRMPPEQLAAWERAAPPITTQIAQRAEGSDARWMWAIALALLAIESWARRSGATMSGGVDGVSRAA